MSGVIAYILASPELLDLIAEDPAFGACRLGVFLTGLNAGSDRRLWKKFLGYRAVRELEGEPTPRDWMEFSAAYLDGQEGDPALNPAWLRWVGNSRGLTLATFRHGPIGGVGPTVDDLAPDLLGGKLGELARDRRVFGFAKYQRRLLVGHPRCNGAFRQEIGDIANYAIGAELHKTHPETYDRLAGALEEVLGALDKQSLTPE